MPGKLPPIGALSEITNTLMNAYNRGKRYFNLDDIQPMLSSKKNMGLKVVGALTNMQNQESEAEAIERFTRAAQQGYNVPAWRAVSRFPVGEDLSFTMGKGAHVDLTPSGYASRIFATRHLPPDLFDPLTNSITGMDLSHVTPRFGKNPRIMTQVAVKPSDNTLLVSDAEANDPSILANILGDPGMFKHLPVNAGDELYWQRLRQALQSEDMSLLYPNIGEVNTDFTKPIDRYTRADRVTQYLDSDEPTDVDSFMHAMRNWSPLTGLGYSDLDLTKRLALGKHFMNNPRDMRYLGNPSYVVTDPRNMRDLHLGQFRNPQGTTIYDKEGGLV